MVVWYTVMVEGMCDCGGGLAPLQLQTVTERNVQLQSQVTSIQSRLTNLQVQGGGLGDLPAPALRDISLVCLFVCFCLLVCLFTEEE